MQPAAAHMERRFPLLLILHHDCGDLVPVVEGHLDRPGARLARDGKVVLSSIKAPSSRFFVGRLNSGALLFVRNNSEKIREKLTAYLSYDDGHSWSSELLLMADPYVSYPDACQGDDGVIYIIYDKDRFKGGHIYMSRVTEQDIIQGKLCSPASALNIEISRIRPV